MIERKVCDLLNYVYHLGLMHFILMGCKKRTTTTAMPTKKKYTDLTLSSTDFHPFYSPTDSTEPEQMRMKNLLSTFTTNVMRNTLKMDKAF